MSSVRSSDRYFSSASGGSAALEAGVRGWVRRRPLTAFLVLVFGIGWSILAVAVLASRHVIPGAGLPVEVFALAVTLLVMLPAALWVTGVTEGRAGVRALLHRAVRWRFGLCWWAVVLFALPVTALLLGLIFGGSLHTTDAAMVLVKQLLSAALAVVVINLWEETVWAGFFQTRLETRFNLGVAALLTAVPFAGVHMPLLLIGVQVSTLSVVKGVGGLLILAVVVRLLIGVVVRAAADSVLAVGILHQVFDASNNKGGVVDSLLDGANEGVMTLAATVLLTATLILICRRRPGFFARRQPPDTTTSAPAGDEHTAGRADQDEFQPPNGAVGRGGDHRSKSQLGHAADPEPIAAARHDRPGPAPRSGPAPGPEAPHPCSRCDGGHQLGRRPVVLLRATG